MSQRICPCWFHHWCWPCHSSVAAAHLHSVGNNTHQDTSPPPPPSPPLSHLSIGLVDRDERLQTSRSVHHDVEVSSCRWSHGLREPLCIHVVVDQTPLLQEPMHPHDGCHISRQVASTCCDGEILSRMQTKAIHHEIAIGHVSGREREREREGDCDG